ncbi:MAG: hypothetical protein UMV23_05515 [Halanaerobium sp.]|nr:hypothetical protein [Halanaerobium sp.]
MIYTKPEAIKFIERLELDSRDVALAHTGGLSGPQQCIMALFSLFNLLDVRKEYKQAIENTLQRRMDNLFVSFPAGYPAPAGGNKTNYYALLDLLSLASEQYGRVFSRFLNEKLPRPGLSARVGRREGHCGPSRAGICCPVMDGQGISG